MTDVEELDKRLITLAAEIAEGTDREVPILLLKVRDFFEELQPASEELKKFRSDVWSYDLVQVLVLVLRQNFHYVNGEWATAAELATFTSNIVIGFDPPDSDSHEFYGICLPSASENMLMLARKLQIFYIEEDDQTLKKKILDNYRTVLDAVNTLFSGHLFLTSNVLRSLWLLQMIISDDVDTVHSVMNLVQYAIRVNGNVLSNLDEKALYALVDEMVFKITSCDDQYLANTAIVTLLLICKVRPYFIEVICTRYRGLRPLTNRWAGHGFGRDLKEFIRLLDAGNAQRAENEKFHQAAKIIQSYYRSYKTRKTLKKADSALKKFHQSYRSRKKIKQREEDEQKVQADLKHQLLVSRKKAMRATREKQVQVIDMLPASAVQRYLEDVSDQAALKIQCLWRGYRIRKSINEKKELASRAGAAVVIQRHVRKFLKRKEMIKREAPAWHRPEGLTDERRVYLQKLILDRREAHPPKARSREEQEELHNNCQHLLKQHVFTNRLNRRKQLHREALLVELETDADLILNAPALSDSTPEDIQRFVSHSLPVATMARENHNNELRLLNQPWWRKLGDEYQDSVYEEGILL